MNLSSAWFIEFKIIDIKEILISSKQEAKKE